jgi:hypothetical protein
MTAKKDTTPRDLTTPEGCLAAVQEPLLPTHSTDTGEKQMIGAILGDIIGRPETASAIQAG